MGVVVQMTSGRSWLGQWWHKLTACPTFWKSFFRSSTRRCPQCKRKIRCYWDGNDCHGMIDVCEKCAKALGPEACNA